MEEEIGPALDNFDFFLHECLKVVLVGDSEVYAAGHC